jgi:molybdenum-dependent DNA-binding transcriptional regulator ModE
MINSNERIIKHKIGLLNLAEEFGNVSQACNLNPIRYRYIDAITFRPT